MWELLWYNCFPVCGYSAQWLYGGIMVTSSKRTDATCHAFVLVCCTQSPYPCGRPLLTCASAGDTQTLKGRSRSVYVEPLGPGVHKVLSEPSVCLWWVWGLILNAISPLLLSCWGFSFALGCGVSFSWWHPMFSCQRLFNIKLQFWSSLRRRWAHPSILPSQALRVDDGQGSLACCRLFVWGCK